jgi:hypothetical protein
VDSGCLALMSGLGSDGAGSEALSISRVSVGRAGELLPRIGLMRWAILCDPAFSAGFCVGLCPLGDVPID